MKTVENESDVETNYSWCSLYSHQKINKGTGEIGNKKTSGDHPNFCVIEIGQNTEKSPGDLRKVAVAQTPVKDHQLTLMWKTFKDESWRLEETCCHSKSSEKPSANTDVKNSKGVR